MIIHFRLLSHDADDFMMEVAIGDTASFMDLHLFIQKCLNYDPSNMASFIITDSKWSRKQEISLLKMNDEDDEVLLMDTTSLSSFVKGVKQRMMYVFDLFSERAFFMEVFNIIEGESITGKLLNKEGTTPEQIKVEDMNYTDNELDMYQMDEGSDDDFLEYDNLDIDNLPDDNY